ncbi:MAG: hypothetical protein ACYCZO_15420 [Daejeonella sp.]
MKTIVIIGGIILAGASIIAVVQNDKKKTEAPVVQQIQSAENKSAPNGTAPALNPAHGLAGHRCDLPVGAPLTNAGSGTPASAQTPQNINMTPTSQPATAPAGLKVNPAHGLPGHRCDLQVGAPLS